MTYRNNLRDTKNNKVDGKSLAFLIIISIPALYASIHTSDWLKTFSLSLILVTSLVAFKLRNRKPALFNKAMLALMLVVAFDITLSVFWR